MDGQIMGTLSAVVIVTLVIGFLVKVTSTLNELRGTAPAFYVQAQSLIKEHKFEDALQKISYAIALVPNESQYHNFRGNILESLLRIEEARDAYARAVRLNPDNPLNRQSKALRKNPQG